MKNLILVVIAAALGFGAAYLVVSQNGEKQLSALRAQLAQASSVEPAPAKDTPQEILQKLAVLNPNAVTNRPRAARQIIFYLESLVNAGDSAVQPISDFIATGKDVDYVLEEKGVSAVGFWNWQPGQMLYSGLVLPPTLRISLVDVLRYIGGPNAETALAAMLQNSTSAVEVAYVGQLLEKIAPGKYRALADAMAKKILAAPADTNVVMRVDMHSEKYLYDLLKSHGDTSEVALAESKLAGPGPVDSDAMEYLLNSLQEQALPTLSKAYNNASPADKDTIANSIYGYVGSSPVADQIFTDWILNSAPPAGSQSVDARARSAALVMLGGGNFGPFGAETPTDPGVIADRLALLNQLQQQIADPNLLKAIQLAEQRLGSIGKK
jgi:hypothetical protein